MKKLLIVPFLLLTSVGFSQDSVSNLLEGLIPGDVDAHYLPNIEREAPIQHLPAFVPTSPSESKEIASPPVDFVKENMEKFAKTPKSFATESAPTKVNSSKLDSYQHESPNTADSNMKTFILGLVVVLGGIGFLLYTSKPSNEIKTKQKELAQKSKMLALKEKEILLREKEIELERRGDKLKNVD